MWTRTLMRLLTLSFMFFFVIGLLWPEGRRQNAPAKRTPAAGTRKGETAAPPATDQDFGLLSTDSSFLRGRLLPAVSKDAAEKTLSEFDHIDRRQRHLRRHAGRMAQQPGRGLLGVERFGGGSIHRHDHLQASQSGAAGSV